jgi:hypothetical protein
MWAAPPGHRQTGGRPTGAGTPRRWRARGPEDGERTAAAGGGPEPRGPRDGPTGPRGPRDGAPGRPGPEPRARDGPDAAGSRCPTTSPGGWAAPAGAADPAGARAGRAAGASRAGAWDGPTGRPRAAHGQEPGHHLHHRGHLDHRRDRQPPAVPGRAWARTVGAWSASGSAPHRPPARRPWAERPPRARRPWPRYRRRRASRPPCRPCRACRLGSWPHPWTSPGRLPTPCVRTPWPERGTRMVAQGGSARRAWRDGEPGLPGPLRCPTSAS